MALTSSDKSKCDSSNDFKNFDDEVFKYLKLGKFQYPIIHELIKISLYRL